MLDRDLRQRGIDDPRLLAAFDAVPREEFVPPSQRGQAYNDCALPLEAGQTISQPFVVAVMLDALHLKDGTRLLEVGAGSGYAAAVAAQIAGRVVALERIGPLAEEAATRLERLGIANVEVHHADGRDGWPDGAPYDAILISAATDKVPKPLVAELAGDGRIVAPVGNRGWGQQLVLYQKRGEKLSRRGFWTWPLCPFSPVARPDDLFSRSRDLTTSSPRSRDLTTSSPRSRDLTTSSQRSRIVTTSTCDVWGNIGTTVERTCR